MKGMETMEQYKMPLPNSGYSWLVSSAVFAFSTCSHAASTLPRIAFVGDPRLWFLSCQVVLPIKRNSAMENPTLNPRRQPCHASSMHAMLSDPSGSGEAAES